MFRWFEYFHFSSLENAVDRLLWNDTTCLKSISFKSNSLCCVSNLLFWCKGTYKTKITFSSVK